MATEEGTWAPKSPDLSSFFSSGGPDPNTPAPFTSAPNLTSVPRPGSGAGYSNSPPVYNNPLHAQVPVPAHAHAHAHVHAHAQAQAQAQAPVAAQHYGQPQPHQTYSSPANYNNLNSYTAPSPNSSRQQYFPPQQPQAQDPFPQVPQPNYVISQPAPSHSGPQPYYSAYAETPASHYLPPQPPQFYKSEFPPSFDQHLPNPSDLGSPMPPRRTAAAQVAQQPEIMESPVKTKFPTARIKRIMQADEEVGKVAQQTPIAVGKALELFMVQIVSKSADVAKDKNSKRITAQMLKQAVEVNPQWDFLQDIVAKVSEKEDKEPKNKAKANDNTDSDDEVEAEPKKKGRGGRKKKAAS
ncbi:hypothetical protein TruAng_002468 [Truncatella angustata]|nr:hypothetical protein TruAng_002468 [Truncatella angustata]